MQCTECKRRMRVVGVATKGHFRKLLTKKSCRNVKDDLVNFLYQCKVLNFIHYEELKKTNTDAHSLEYLYPNPSNLNIMIKTVCQNNSLSSKYTVGG